jgi:hypothetical protein
LKRDDWEVPDDTWPERPAKNEDAVVLPRHPGMREQRGMGAPPRADGRMRAVHS